MKIIPFVKYTSCGNNFVIVDETEHSFLNEAEKSRFAFQATNTSFGVGCDNLLVIQRCTKEVLQNIAKERPYWRWPPGEDSADFLFRMFEPDGEEALCCGNGLICVAGHLLNAHNISSASIMTEIPLAQPKTIEIGAGENTLGGWVNLGHPRRTPVELALPSNTDPLSHSIDRYTELKIKFRAGDLRAFSEETELYMNAYLVFTGEPHLVIFPDSDFSIPELADYIFGSSEQWSIKDRRESFGTWLVDHIGHYMNSRFKALFPAGINVNLARSQQPDVIENRCFERGINRETLACGTGALAVAYVYSHLNNLNLDEIDILPHRCRWHDDQARIRIQSSDAGWRLASQPVMLFDGHYRLLPDNNPLVEAVSSSGASSDTSADTVSASKSGAGKDSSSVIG
ncbi:diaminopimelate epimerase [Amphritea balenae]|uniref:Diaminopimelate epimerase n=1 Tax=Amphritea balenae TaxID=452629 RepID=A0A3P1SR77_9GAMM|nr:diaminopimelate epimerase [Amphritea balenae]RRC99569.1 diaminopimelate epimerase [Amphritea balenae]GGK78109.1 diaminopimelate epimerase [Amphritea balenae]